MWPLPTFRQVGDDLVEQIVDWAFPPRVGDTVRLDPDEPLWSVVAVIHVVTTGDVGVYLAPARDVLFMQRWPL